MRISAAIPLNIGGILTVSALSFLKSALLTFICERIWASEILEPVIAPLLTLWITCTTVGIIISVVVSLEVSVTEATLICALSAFCRAIVAFTCCSHWSYACLREGYWLNKRLLYSTVPHRWGS